MPLFHLHICNGLGFTPDEDGLELPDLLAARQTAVEGARSLLSEEVRAGKMDFAGRIEIADHTNRVIDIVRFDEVVVITRGDGK